MLSPNTRLGYVHLTVSDIKRSLAFYRHSLGMQLHWRKGNVAALGAGQVDLLVLTEQPGAVKPGRHSGLYHFAILVPSRKDLARSIKNIIETETNVTGGADHLVSEALYLDDPDGNGIEIYRDRPRSTWKDENGQIKMAVDPLDYQGILSELETNNGDWSGPHPDTVLGHMHLHVAHLPESITFYEKVIGLDLMATMMGSAAFLSAGGYHHHLGINIWNGEGAPAPPSNSTGLRYFTIKLADPGDLTALIERLNGAGALQQEHEEGIFIQDPSGNGIVLTDFG
jgi:catechol 2,3-dioxygenase